MKPITLPVAELKPALTGLSKIITKRTTLPVLGCVLVQRNPDGWITLTATDLDSTAIVRLEQPGTGASASLLVPFAELQKTVKSCKNGEDIMVETVGEQVILRYPIGNQFAEQKIDSMVVEEFPPVPQINGTPVKLEPLVRSSLLDAMQCASTDETRVIINGAYLDVSQPSGHYVVATDGRHLYSSNSFQLALKDSVFIPDHKFLGWKEFSNDGEWQLSVQPVENDKPGLLQISSRRWQFITRQVEGNYPSWRQVVPGENQYKTAVLLPPEAVESVLSLIAKIPCHDAVNRTIGLKVDGKLSLRGRNAGDSKWTDFGIEGTEVKGSPATIYLNRDFLAKALRFGLNQIQIIDPLTPLRFSSGGRQMIVMPIRADSPPPQTTPAAPASLSSPPAAIKPDPAGDQNERTPMPEHTTNGAQRSAPATTEKPALETAIAQIDSVKTGFREAIAGLNKLSDLLRQAQREQKAGEKEVQSVRQTLRSLQSVRI